MKFSIKTKKTLLVVGLIILISMIVLLVTYARFQSRISGNAEAEIAIPVVSFASSEALTLPIDDLEPGSTKEYLFDIVNFKNGKRTDVDMLYKIKLETGGNLPLTFKLYKDGSSINILNTDLISSIQAINHNIDQTHNYKLVIIWDIADNDAKYAEEIDYVRIEVKSEQTTVTPPIVYLPFDGKGEYLYEAFQDNVSNQLFYDDGGTITSSATTVKVGNKSSYFSGTDISQRINSNVPNLNHGTNDFTYSFWIYAETQISSYPVIFGGDSNNAITSFKMFLPFSSQNYVSVYLGNTRIIGASEDNPINTWMHYALVRKDGIFTIYQNGIAIGSTTSYLTYQVDNSNLSLAGNDTVTTPYKGYIDDFAVYDYAKWEENFTPPNIAQTDANLLYLDFDTTFDFDRELGKELILNTRFENKGKTYLYGSDSNFKFGLGSMYFNGTSKQRLNKYIPSLNFGKNDFSISMWLNQETMTNQYGIVCSHDDNANGNALRLFNRVNYQDKMVLYIGGTMVIDVEQVHPFDEWVHYAIVRKDGVFTIYQNGVTIGTSANHKNLDVRLDDLSIGGNNYNNGSYKGYIDDFAVFDYAKWNTNFSVPTGPIFGS